MSQRRVKRKRSKGLVLVLLPALIFIGVIGWLIYWAEPPHRKASKWQQEPSKTVIDDGVTFIPNIYEEHKEITNQ